MGYVRLIATVIITNKLSKTPKRIIIKRLLLRHSYAKWTFN